jgi:hypothetical protein
VAPSRQAAKALELNPRFAHSAEGLEANRSQSLRFELVVAVVRREDSLLVVCMEADAANGLEHTAHGTETSPLSSKVQMQNHSEICPTLPCHIAAHGNLAQMELIAREVWRKK